MHRLYTVELNAVEVKSLDIIMVCVLLKLKRGAVPVNITAS